MIQNPEMAKDAAQEAWIVILRHARNEECVLFNPDGDCSCRMKKHVVGIDLPSEYQKLKKTIKDIHFFRESRQILDIKDHLA
jgi:hypothetical protein